VFWAGSLGEDRGLIREPIADQLDACKAANGGRLDQGLFHRRVGEGLTLVQQMNAQHRCQRIGSAAAFLVRLGVVRLDKIEESLPRHHSLYLGEKLIALSSLLSRGQLIVRESELHAGHGLGLLDRQLAGQLHPPSGSLSPALCLLRFLGKGLRSSHPLGIDLVADLSRRCCLDIGSLGSRFSGQLFCGSGVLLTAAGVASGGLRLQLRFGLAQGVQPILAALQLLGQLIVTLDLSVARMADSKSAPSSLAGAVSMG